MPRQSRRTKNNNPSDKEDGGSFSKSDLKLAKTALVKAVVNDGNTSSSSSADYLAFLKLFGGAASNTNLPVMLSKPEGLNLRQQRQILLQTVASFDNSTHELFFGALQKLVESVIEQQLHVPDSAFASDNDDEDDDKYAEDDDLEIVPDAKSSKALSFLHYATLCVQSSFNNSKPKSPKNNSQDDDDDATNNTNPLYETAVALHNILDNLVSFCGPDAAPTISAIVSLCESWWLNDGPDKENLIVQALAIIVETAYETHKLKRLYGIRTALNVIDWDDDEARNFYVLLQQVATSPASLKTPEGKKFLLYLLAGMDNSTSIISKLHASIRPQIPQVPKTVLTIYGQIYYRAWKESSTTPETRTALEDEVLQDLMYAAIHVADRAMATRLLQVLDAFHKKNAATEDLLHRMYGPFLWRSLTSAANPQVRVQAAHVLAEVFPLAGGSASGRGGTAATAADKDTVLMAVKKSCAALKTLLQDPDPRVRVAGSEAVAKVLTTYWDVVPPAEIRGLLNRTFVFFVQAFHFLYS